MLLRGYRPNRRRAWTAAALIVGAAAVGAGVMCAWGLRRIEMGRLLAALEIFAYRSVSSQHAEFVEVVTAMLVLFLLLVYIAGVAFLVWLDRAVGNLRSLAIRGPWLQPGGAVGAVLAACPAPAVAMIVPGNLGQDSSPFLIALVALAGASLVFPFVVVGRLWNGSTGFPTGGHGFRLGAIPTEAGVIAWWTTFVLSWTAYGLGDFAGQFPDEDIYPFVETSTRMVIEGVLTVVAAIALVASAALVIRIIFSVNSMQDSLALVLPRQSARAARPAVAVARRPSANWRCESCDALNSRAVSFCENCARQRR